MARTNATVALSIGDDDDYRNLTRDAQHLYLTLMISSSLSYCGVADWRPARLAAMAQGWTPHEIEVAGYELATARFVVIDEATEEVLLRSFVRHDGLMSKPRMAVSMAKAFASTASRTIRGVIVHELRRLHDEEPDLGGWLDTHGKPGVALGLLHREPIDPAELAKRLPSVCPSVCQAFATNACSDLPSVCTPPTTATATATGYIKASMPPQRDEASDDQPEQPGQTTRQKPRRGTRIPEDFAVTDDMKDWARKHTPHINGHIETANFVDYWQSKAGKDAVKLDWTATWRTWMRNAEQRSPQGREATQAAAPRSDGWSPPDPPDEVLNDPDPSAYPRWIRGQIEAHERRTA